MVNLIIGGGSIKGVAYTGALEYLHSNNLLANIKKFYGSSVGSIIGIFYCSGYSPFQILQILLSLNFEDLWDFSFDNIEKKYSILSNLFFIKIREIYSQSENPNITFKQFYEKYNIDLNIFATSLTSRSNICFNKDNYPDVEILTVVQASSSIPLVFPPVIINDEYFNIQIGSYYISDLTQDFDGAIYMAFAAYNAGPHRVKRWIRRFGDPRKGEIDPIDWIELIPFTETRNYVQRVIENIQVYKYVINKKTVTNDIEKILF